MRRDSVHGHDAQKMLVALLPCPLLSPGVHRPRPPKIPEGRSHGDEMACLSRPHCPSFGPLLAAPWVSSWAYSHIPLSASGIGLSKAPVFLRSPRLPSEPQTEAPAGWFSYSSLAPPFSLAQFNPNPFIPQTPSCLTKIIAPAAPWPPASTLCSLPQQLLSIPQQHQAFLNPRACAHPILSADNRERIAWTDQA